LYSLTQLTILKAAECGLLGSLPDDIHRLSLLHELSLYNNDLTGSLPEGMSRLIHLRQVSISYNQFHGTLPDYFDDFLLLQEFWALNNDFTGSVPSFSQAPDIHKIYLNDNSLGGEIPSDFMEATVSTMREYDIHVNLAGNELTGLVPESLDNLEDLNIVWMLGDNQWTGVPGAICDNVNWNQGAVEQYGCFGFLCPPETFSRHGFQTPDTACQPCQSSEFFGATTCFDKDDRSVLVELYVALQGESWDRSDNWLIEDNFCSWYGVECWDIGDSKTGRVRRIVLPNNGLVGNVPETIYSIQHLTTINFSRNDIVLPFTNVGEAEHIFSVNVAKTRTKDFDGIEEATDFFHELYVDQTPISGSLPNEILQMPNLKILSLQECDLSGELPDGLFEMGSLRELYLSNNDLRGNLPDRWDELENLEVLALAKNQFRGSIPRSFDSASSLTAISLQDQVTKGGGLSGAVNPLSTTITIRTLHLAKNKLEGDLPENLLTAVEGDLPITVDLSNNLITGKVHGTYDRFRKMNLYLEGNFITEVEEQLCDQTDWMSGSVAEYGCEAILCPAGTVGGRRQFTDNSCKPCDSNRIGEGGEMYLGQSVCGKDLSENLSERDLLELLYDSCGGTGWHARDSWMSDEPICDWYGVDCDENGSVTSLQLGSNKLMGSFPTELFLLPNLRHLKLYSNALNFRFEGIENAKNLESLGLDNTGLRTLQGVGRARSLVELNVASNNLGGAIPEEVSRLVNLRSFDISNNKFSGYLPYWLRGLVSLSTFLASRNRFSGPVYDFATLFDIVYIDISQNKLTGAIPPTFFGGASGNEKLVADLSSNSLSGSIPGELSRLSRLSLQVQGNQISGLDEGLCEVDGWNDFDVQKFGCDAILCPAGTWNHHGRQSNEESPCLSCRKAKFMGSTQCSSGSSFGTLGLWAFVVVSWMLL